MLKERCKDVVDKIAVLNRDVETMGGALHKKGARYRIATTWRGKFALVDADRGYDGPCLRGIPRHYFDLEETNG